MCGDSISYCNWVETITKLNDSIFQYSSNARIVCVFKYRSSVYLSVPYLTFLTVTSAKEVIDLAASTVLVMFMMKSDQFVQLFAMFFKISKFVRDVSRESVVLKSHEAVI